MKTVFGMTYKKKQKKVFMWFCTRWAPFFLNQSTLGAILARIFREFAQIFPGFTDLFPGFSPNKTFWGSACTPCTPASYTTVCSDSPSVSNKVKRWQWNQPSWYRVEMSDVKNSKFVQAISERLTPVQCKCVQDHWFDTVHQKPSIKTKKQTVAYLKQHWVPEKIYLKISVKSKKIQIDCIW